MTCQEFDQWLDVPLETKTKESKDAAVAHVLSCDACRAKAYVVAGLGNRQPMKNYSSQYTPPRTES